jgi:predicted aconitase with swiveling domain
MLELLRNRVAPTALLLSRHDGILVLGVLVARELGYPTIPVTELTAPTLAALPPDCNATVLEDGTLQLDPSA